MMSGCGILTNGKGTRREYGQFNLDELSVSIVIFFIFFILQQQIAYGCKVVKLMCLGLIICNN